MYVCNYTMVRLLPSELLKHLELGMTEAFSTTAREEKVSESETERNKREKVKEGKDEQRRHRNKPVEVQQLRLVNAGFPF